MIADYIDLERTISVSRSEPAVSDPLWLMPEDRKQETPLASVFASTG